jgi:hypothetical protein
VDPRHRFLSTISQPGRWLTYFLVCLGISTVAYAALGGIVKVFHLPMMSLALISFQAINFHHYIVDGIIWKVRKPQLRENLGLTG